MSKDSFARWLKDQPYYVTRNDYERAQDRHDVTVKLPKGITILWDDDYGDEGTDRIPARDIRHGEWFDK